MDSYNPPSRDDQMQVITAPTDDYLYLMQIVEGFLNELLPFEINLDEVKYMFNKFNDLYDGMTGVVDDFSSADSQEQSSSSYYSHLAKSFSEMVGEIPEMFTALLQYFKEKQMSKEASEMESIENMFNLDSLLKLCSKADI